MENSIEGKIIFTTSFHGTACMKNMYRNSMRGKKQSSEVFSGFKTCFEKHKNPIPFFRSVLTAVQQPVEAGGSFAFTLFQFLAIKSVPPRPAA
jgi:hypothetical protein